MKSKLDYVYPRFDSRDVIANLFPYLEQIEGMKMEEIEMSVLDRKQRLYVDIRYRGDAADRGYQFSMMKTMLTREKATRMRNKLRKHADRAAVALAVTS